MARGVAFAGGRLRLTAGSIRAMARRPDDRRFGGTRVGRRAMRTAARRGRSPAGMVPGRSVSTGSCDMRSWIQAVVRFMKKEDGPTAVEYAIMLALVVTVCIGVVSQFGSQARDGTDGPPATRPVASR